MAPVLNTGFVSGDELGPNVTGDGPDKTFLFPRPRHVADGGFVGAYLTGSYADFGGFTVNGSNFTFLDGTYGVVIHAYKSHVHGIRVTNIGGGASGAALAFIDGNMDTITDTGAFNGGGGANQMAACEIIRGGGYDWFQPFCSNFYHNLIVQDEPASDDGQRIYTNLYGGVIDECGDVTAGVGCTQLVNSFITVTGTAFWARAEQAGIYAISVDTTSQINLTNANLGSYCASCIMGQGITHRTRRARARQHVRVSLVRDWRVGAE